MRGLSAFGFAFAWVSIAWLAPGADAAMAQAPTLVFLSDDVPAGLNYDGPAAALPTSQTGFLNLMEPLVSYARAGDSVNEDGVGLLDFTRFEGRLAERWEFDAASLTWTFHLRRGVKSCAGNELTADDVVYTFARAKSVSGAAPIGWFLSSVASIDGFTVDVLTDPAKRSLGTAVRKIDDYTVAIRQAAPNSLFLPALAAFGLLIFDSVEARRMATPQDPWAHEAINNVNAPGFGAYCLERWRKGSEFVLRANPNHWKGPPKVSRVVIKRVPQSSNRFILVRMGEAQLAEKLTPREALKMRETPGRRVFAINGNETLFVHLNFRMPPFDNPLIRQAVQAALPRDWIIRNGYFGQAKPWFGQVPSSYPGAVEMPDRFEENPERARALLAQAGYPEGKGLERFADAFKLIYPAEKETTLGPIATAVRNALRAFGMPVELEPVPATQYGDRQLVKKDLPFALNDQEKPVVVDAGYAVQLFFASPAAGGVNNMVNYENATVDALWAAARIEPDASRRTALIAQIQEKLIADLAFLPIVEYRTQWAATANLRGLVWYPDNAVRFADLEFAP